VSRGVAPTGEAILEHSGYKIGLKPAQTEKMAGNRELPAAHRWTKADQCELNSSNSR
jgi:hypothetical protein